MKMHKFEVYVIDFEDFGLKDCQFKLQNIKGLYGTAFHTGTVEIGEWNDDHKFNDPRTTIEDFRNAK